MTVLAHYVLLSALLTSVAAAVFYFRAASLRDPRLALPRTLLLTSVSLIAVASAILIVLLLKHDFSNGYVYGYSDSTLPLHFLLSSFYAGQEGSFLFWCLCSALIALWLMRSRQTTPAMMTVYLFAHSMLLLLVFAKSPFRMIWEVYPQVPVGQVPADGHGLNPLLQNFWMVIHPPVLFLGFALMAVPFSQAIAAMWTRRYDALAREGLGWVLLGAFVLGLGIMLGAYWAYGVLGWGGYWGWDPVENSSLIPWLTAVALVHTIIAQRRTGKYLRTNFVLAVATFVLVIYSTFLTRSGILGDASVHSFTDPGSAVYGLLLVFLALIAIMGTAMIVARWRDMAPPAGQPGWLTRELLLGAGAIVLLLSAVVILFGTSLPIFSTTRVEPSFYDSTNLPVAILIAFLIGVSLYTQWEESDVRFTLQKSWKTLLAALLISAAFVAAGMRDPLTSVLVFTALFAFLVNLEIGVTGIRGGVLFLGGKLAHIGIALFLIGVVSTGKYNETARVALPLHQPVQVLGHTLSYEGYTVRPDGKYEFRVGAVAGTHRFTLLPVMFEAPQQGIMRNPDIASLLTSDFYISPISLEPAQQGAAQEEHELAKGSTIALGEATMTFARFEMGPGDGGMGAHGPAAAITAVLEVQRGKDRETLLPALKRGDTGETEYRPAHSHVLGTDVRLLSMHIGMSADSPSTIVVGLQRPDASPAQVEVLMVEASVKPFILVLWAGTVIMLVGFVLAFIKRMREAV
jgi:cytochrome c-type biogenesis protein CcmF